MTNLQLTGRKGARQPNDHSWDRDLVGNDSAIEIDCRRDDHQRDQRQMVIQPQVTSETGRLHFWCIQDVETQFGPRETRKK